MNNGTAQKSASAVTLSKKSSNKGGKNATRGHAKQLDQIIVGFRQDKVTASKLINHARKTVGDILNTKGISPEDKKTAIDVAIKKVKSELMAAVDRDLARATSLSAMPRGTTGKSGVDYIDVIAEIFAPLSRKTAKENNTKALTSSGLI